MEGEIRCPKTDQEWQDYYQLRYDVLRKPLNQPPGSERNEGDDTGDHFALFVNHSICAIGRLDEVNDTTDQVRFVAVEPRFQKRGFGAHIMLAMEEKSRNSGKEKIILHARDYAVDFYLNIGYLKIEKSYLLFDVLQHYLMEKNL